MRFKATLQQDDKTTGTFFEVPEAVMSELGGKRVPVRGEINGIPYRAWATRYRGVFMTGVRADQRAEMGIAAGDEIEVEMERDTEERVVEVPEALQEELARDEAAAEAWERLSYSSKREHATAVAGAKKPETRDRRVAKILESLRQHG